MTETAVVHASWFAAGAHAGKLSMYRKEHKDFRSMLSGPEAVTEVETKMWQHLERMLES